MSKFITRVVVATIPILFMAASAVAQSSAGSGLSGRVADYKRRVDGRSHHHCRAAGSGIRARSTHGADSGDWEARFLPPGTYHASGSSYADSRRCSARASLVTTGQMATVDATLEVGNVTEAVAVSADARMVSADSAAIARTLDRQRARSAAHIGAQHHAACWPSSRRVRRHQRAAVERQRVDLAERERRPDDQQQLRVQRDRRHEHAVLQQPDQRVARHDRRRRRHAVAQHRARAGDARRSEAADQPVRRVDRPERRRHFPGRVEERHEHVSGTAYHYFQHDALLANDYFFNRAGTDKPRLRRNEGGFTLGGPWSRNRTFFFGSYQATRAETSFVDEASNTVLLPMALTDDRSNAAIDAFAAAIWDTSLIRSGQSGGDQPDLASAASGTAAQRHVPRAVRSGGFNCGTREDQVAPAARCCRSFPRRSSRISSR